MRVLGVHANFHDSGAALLEESRVVAAVSEERLSRIKMDGQFPYASIREVLRIGNIAPKDLDVIAFSGGKVGVNKVFRYVGVGLQKIYRVYKEDLKKRFWKTLTLFIKRAAAHSFSQAKVAVYETLSTYYLLFNFRRQGFVGDVHFFEHDYCHAIGAYYTSGIEDALVCVIEGSSIQNSASSWIYTEGDLRKVHAIPLPHSIGGFYQLATLLLGFNPHKHGGKVTGLAAYGDPQILYKEVTALLTIVGTEVSMSDDVLRYYHEYLNTRTIPAIFKGHTKENIAAAFQKCLEEVVVQLVRNLLKEHHLTKVVVSGGVAANVKLNFEIAKIEGLKKLIVHPPMSDCGQPLGAAYAALRIYNTLLKPKLLSHVYWGSVYTEQDIEQALLEAGVSYIRPASFSDFVASELAKDKVVGLFMGAMEFGPRALGNRSVLATATHQDIASILNEKLRRSEFMPFAPVTLSKDASLYYESGYSARVADNFGFMTVALPVTEYMKKVSPAVVHIDGTARPQVITKETNEVYYSILEKYKALTGVATLINTSFNMHEEPIVRTPREALRAFKEGRLDGLAIYPFFVTA